MKKLFAFFTFVFLSGFTFLSQAAQCDWNGTIFPLCTSQASGWGWENSQSCVGYNACPKVISTTPTTGTQCNWNGTVFPLCTSQASGWGWENSKSCIALADCSKLASPYGVIGGSSSSTSSSSVASSSSISSSSTSSSASSAANDHTWIYYPASASLTAPAQLVSGVAELYGSGSAALWRLNAPVAGDYRITLTWSAPYGAKANSLVIDGVTTSYSFSESTSPVDYVQTKTLAAGTHTIGVQVGSGDWGYMNLHSVKLELLGNCDGNGNNYSVCTDSKAGWETLMGGNTFSDYANFESSWNYLYPWGSDHNGSARMYASANDRSQVYLEGGNVLVLKASPVSATEGKSTANPYLTIKYHSGAVHAKTQVMVTEQFPNWEVRGEFQAPTSKGTWPAFWLSGAWTWPPELDILELKGSATNWFNTFRSASDVSTTKVAVASPGNWHQYKAWITKVNATDVDVHYYIDDKWYAVHRASGFVGKPMWVIINLQMEGSAGAPGPTSDTYYRARNLYIGRSRAY